VSLAEIELLNELRKIMRAEESLIIKQVRYDA
jgi:hypothetical protein